MEPNENQSESQSIQIDLGEISIFVKTTKLDRKILSDLYRIIRQVLEESLSFDLALIKTEEITEAQKNGTLRSFRFFYRIFKASKSVET